MNSTEKSGNINLESKCTPTEFSQLWHFCIVKAKKKSIWKSERILKFDNFGVPILFNYDGEGTTHWRTCCGACLSVFIVLLAAFYLLYNT